VTVRDRRTVWVVIRMAASLVMLAVLISRIHLGSVLPEWTASQVAWLIAALFATAGSMVLAAVRWHTVLDALDELTRVGQLLYHYLAGQFVGNFLPSTIGGDVLRAKRLTEDGVDGADSFASVVLERLTGWVVLPFITLIALAANPGLRELGQASQLAAAVALLTLMVLSVVLWAVAHPKLGGRLAGHEGWLRFAGAVHLGLARFRRHPSSAGWVLASGLAYQLGVVFAAYLAARVLGIAQVGITAALAFIPVVAIVQVLPITFAGFGLREGALVLFLEPLGVSTGQAIALGLLIYGLNLVVSLAGAPSFAVGGRRPSRTLTS
jgi:glycosyltransferase 2 family protein